MLKYGVISGPYFPALGQNTERYSECGEIQTRNNSVFGHLSRSAWHHENNFQSLFKQSRILVSRDNYHFLKMKSEENLSGCLFYQHKSSRGKSSIRLLLLEKGLSELVGECPYIFKKSNIDCFMERSSATLYNEKYSVLNEFCCAEYLYRIHTSK